MQDLFIFLVSNFHIVAFFGAAFAIGFVFTRLKLLTENNTEKWCMWLSGILAAAVALAADGPGGWREVGRLGIFVLVWLIGGLVLTIGILTGQEQANKKKK